MRIFVASAAEHLTDHLPNGEGLIAHAALSGLVARGHVVTACAKRLSLSAPPPYRVVRPSRASRFESLEPLRHAAVVRRALQGTGGHTAYDVAWWLFPQGSEYMFEVLPRTLPVVIGPLATPWPEAAERSRARPGDAVRALVRPLLHLMHRATIQRAHAMLAVPDSVSILPVSPLRTTVVPFAVDHLNFRASPVPPDPLVLFVGRLTVPKGAADLIEAFPAVLRSHPQALLRVAGMGALSSTLRDRANDLGIAGNVEFLGPIAHTQIPKLIESCALLAAPSDGEPYGMAVLEAMSGGRAVLACDNGGPPFLIDGDEGGRLVRPHDVNALSGALVELLADHPLLQEMGRRNRARVEEEFSWDVVLDKLEAVLQAAADQR